MKLSSFSFGLLASNFSVLVLGDENCTKTVVFPLKLTWGKGAPDGFERDMIFMNGKFPGPPLNIEEGSNVEFIVDNQLPFDTTIHFHGIEQLHTPWSDGVPGVSQKPIPSGSKFTYKWTATQYGTYWYHGHRQGQLEDGLFGAIHIKPKDGTVTPFSLISNNAKDLSQMQDAANNPELVLLSDWSHATSQELRNVSLTANIDPLCGDTILVNGLGRVDCPGVPFFMSLVPPPVLPLLMGLNLTDKGCIPAMDLIAQTAQPHDFGAIPEGIFSGCEATSSPLSTIRVDKQKGWASLNFISTASLQEMVVSIDNHPMWVYAVDGRYVEPVKVDAITFSHGSRHSVMIELDQPGREYTIRVAGDGLNQKVFATATFEYAGGRKHNIPNPSINYAGGNTTANVTFLDDTTVVPFPPVKPAQAADQTVKLLLNRTGPAWQWSLNDNAPYNLSLEDVQPLLFNPKELANTGLTITTKNNTWVDLIFIATITAGLQPPHPIHKHSNKGFIIGAGLGEFNYTDVAEAMQYIPENFNLENPPYRDGFYTLPVATASTWLAVRYQVVNPGAFLLHCHINPHLTGGMGIAILDGVDAWPTVPAEYAFGNGGA